MESDLRLAHRAALAGAEVALRHFASFAALTHERKPDGSVVTEADRAVEAAIREVLGRARPGDAILGEETGLSGVGERRWIVDPIDGTSSFVAGDDRWLVLLALEEAGRIVVAVAAVPAQGRIWWASRGGGAFEAGLRGATVSGGHRIGVDRQRADTLRDSRLGVIPDDRYLSPAELDWVAPLRAATSPTPWRTHGALLLARGDLDLVVQTRGQVWDFAATALIVEEAGGHYGGLSGSTRPDAGPSVFARNTALHAAALTILTEHPAPRR